MSTAKPLVKITVALCDAFATASDALRRRRAREIADADIDQFVALRWLEWCGGTLRVTEVGELVLMKLQTRLALAA